MFLLRCSTRLMEGSTTWLTPLCPGSSSQLRGAWRRDEDLSIVNAEQRPEAAYESMGCIQASAMHEEDTARRVLCMGQRGLLVYPWLVLDLCTPRRNGYEQCTLDFPL
ncbi:hypothetical protein DUNSADRAFT_8830 [Dunaliella salina]|uniref:Encoded protein n=1 Tax=Dunaliella salina TaxID=3046 RepID=A0ABQ7GIU2_DUNSA|nr:hypothetical protein DUNSADRAFT_8830 [Dunaliella salina]|eukprot:KAF5834474.1 hypothetical protein DUNSADRAFT_8830 [Dunaliella salina]